MLYYRIWVLQLSLDFLKIHSAKNEIFMQLRPNDMKLRECFSKLAGDGQMFCKQSKISGRINCQKWMIFLSHVMHRR